MTTLAPTAGAAARRRSVLDPLERSSEILFGLIMALTFTLSLSAATAGREEIRTMLFGAIGCNLAWGLVDAVMYLIDTVAERGRRHASLARMRRATPEDARSLILAALPEEVAGALQAEALEELRLALDRLPVSSTRPRLVRDDFIGALGVFLLVVLSTLPVAIPFILMTNSHLALRVSNGIAVGMMFLTGYSVGRYAALGAWRMGLVMVGLGVVLVGLTIALGG